MSGAIAIAGANLVGLSAARTVARTREIAVQRAIGAGRSDIFFQFLVESMVVAVLALVVGLGLAAVAPLSEVFGDSLTLSQFGDWKMPVGMAGLTVLVGLAAR